MTDKTLITKALKLWFEPGDVFEIRALDAITTDYRRPHVESGYFDYEHIDTAAKEVAKLCSYGGVYVTINPVNPDLLARACNRMKYAGKTPATGDGDILRRRWLLIDCDAVRPAGISSTDAEHEAALAKAREIRDHLTSLGWPEPIMLDSGNGAQMTYRIDLSSDDGGLVLRVLAALSVMSDDRVKLDVTVCNPARIWRLPGTMNCKGDSTETRPHRPARPADSVSFHTGKARVVSSCQYAADPVGVGLDSEYNNIIAGQKPALSTSAVPTAGEASSIAVDRVDMEAASGGIVTEDQLMQVAGSVAGASDRQ
ncbi:MAG: hypothetical protein LBH08_02780 [Puniceicoccales bacterium]|jgi:hypothetical protein|nr:hypothetical protein [Puniceicoccales bacterium]